MNRLIYILGVGHNTIVTIDLAESAGYEIGGLYHYLPDRIGEDYFGHKIIGCNDELFKSDLTGISFALSIGDNDIRADLFNKIISKGGNVPTLIHPSSIVSKYSQLGTGVCVHANSVIAPDTIIGDDCIISHNDLVTHGVRMGNHCFMASNIVLGAYTTMEDYSFIGSGATIISAKAKRLGYHSIIGAGSVVTKPVGDNEIVYGNPAHTKI